MKSLGGIKVVGTVGIICIMIGRHLPHSSLEITLLTTLFMTTQPSITSSRCTMSFFFALFSQFVHLIRGLFKLII